ncbi:DUF1656 domain-containing protein [Vibrio astriarenae]
MPHEIAWGEIYIPPLIIVVAISYIACSLIFYIAIKIGAHKYIASTAIAELSLFIICCGLISKYIPIF